MFKLVAAAALVLAAPASAALYEYSHVESPGAVFETNYDPSGPDNANGVFEVTFAPGQNQNCATIGLDIDEAGDETVSLIGSPSAGQSYHAGPYVAGALANAVRGASRPGCRGLDNSIAAAAASNDNYVALSHNVGAVPEGSWVRVTFRLSSTNQGGNGIALGSGLFLTSSQETLDSFGCDAADVPAQCLHAREAVPEARITSEATGGRITASSARKCLTVAVIADDGQDHQAECNYETTVDTKRASA